MHVPTAASSSPPIISHEEAIGGDCCCASTRCLLGDGPDSGGGRPGAAAVVHEAGGREQRLHQAGGQVRGERVQARSHDPDELPEHVEVLVLAGGGRRQQLLDGALGDQLYRHRRQLRLHRVGHPGLRLQDVEAPHLRGHHVRSIERSMRAHLAILRVVVHAKLLASIKLDR